MNKVTSGNASACRTAISISNTSYGKPTSIYDPRKSLKDYSTGYCIDRPQLLQYSPSGLTVSLDQSAGAPWGGKYENSLEYENPTSSVRHVLPRLTVCSVPRDNAPQSRRTICHYWGEKSRTRHDRPQPGHRPKMRCSPSSCKPPSETGMQESPTWGSTHMSELLTFGQLFWANQRHLLGRQWSRLRPAPMLPREIFNTISAVVKAHDNMTKSKRRRA